MPEGASSLFSQSEEIEVLWVDFSVLSEVQGKCAGENVDEKVKELVLVDFTVCLLLFARHIHSKQTF
ncbi:hypothetical protein C482_14866 [Natrialba chahannaoensis JCM 10990]|uniref:Uncharacterized protein n=1 Tax=Natrialba chahannaoensis JCM 10990 TaxID=1227492 RepID=M0AE33_9EURY|nr:hypothetical protein C482_14866 [Natrialba chahannaoensis JCM 10990]